MKVLIIGSGSIGQRHMRNLLAVAPDTQFIALRHKQGLVENWTDVPVFIDLQEAVLQKPDAAILASPSAHHFQVLPQLIAMGIPTYVEKPIVTDESHAKQIWKLLHANPEGRHVAGFNLRLLPSLQFLKANMADLGDIVRASFTAGQWLPDWRKAQDHRKSYSANPDAGGGVLFDLSHELDAARLLLGELTLMHTATRNIPALEIASEAVALITATSSTDALVNVTLDYVSRAPVRRYEIVGTRGTMVWDLQAKQVSIATQYGRHVVGLPLDAFDVSATYLTAMADFATYATTGHIGKLQSLSDGLRSTELSIAAHKLRSMK